MNSIDADFFEELASQFEIILGEQYVLRDSAIVKNYARSTLPCSTTPLMVVKPSCTLEV